jgi:NitT/TauT family transport system ATP-binding protein
VHMTPRPGRIRQILPADFAKPRTVDLQTTPEFNDIVRRLRHDLDEEE